MIFKARKFILSIASIFEGNPYGIALVTFFSCLVLAVPAINFLDTFVPRIWAVVTTFCVLFSLSGWMGILIMKYKQAPVQIPFVTGRRAFLIGLFFTVFSFGIIFALVVINFKELFSR